MHIALQGSEVTVSSEVIFTRVLLPRMVTAVKRKVTVNPFKRSELEC